MAGLAGCGNDPAAPGEDRVANLHGPSLTPSPGPVEFTKVALLSESDVGGTVAPLAVAVDDDAAVAAFTGQFEGTRMTKAVEGAVADTEVRAGQALVGSVVGIGCTPPVQLLVRLTGAGLKITAPEPKERMQCLVPVTTVALVTVDAALLAEG